MALKQWLAEQRPELANEIFLDIDPESGMQPGARWKGQLFEEQLPLRGGDLFAVEELGSVA